MERKLHHLESFSAVGSDGSTHKVIAYEHVVRNDLQPDLSMPWESTGEVEFRLDDGRRVVMHADGAMELAGTPVTLERVNR